MGFRLIQTPITLIAVTQSGVAGNSPPPDSQPMASRSKQQSLPGLENDAPKPRRKSPASGKAAKPSAPAAGVCTPVVKVEKPEEGESCPPQPQAVDIKGWNVYIVDAHSLIFQVFHALPEMSSPRGE